ncbi:hypothetical protein [Marivita geojedonensis]|uniref:Uncharacterized protein n=1 Tax=Marivita geojedonensis TaxID=1123756 RepID=A0A1X4N959_9RHOB|nr:hypothetical protein [Marivita geojedonensis]OSQ42890.1 hypothetical protein MGEO_20160 [Marivita geojedonensis]PRY71855.1 hypothetical protein CLV76_13918 [Marivita geojedonensis]
MSFLTKPMVGASLLAASFVPSIAGASDSLEALLGGSVVQCTGAMAWSEIGTADDLNVEPMRIAARDSADANGLAIFLGQEDIMQNNVWSCVDGLCTASVAATGNSITTNTLQLRKELDLPGGEAVYQAIALFMIFVPGEDAFEVEGTSGQGAFLCDGTLPAGVVASP